MSCWPGAAPLAWVGPRRTSSGMAPRCSIESRASSARAVDGPVVVVRAPDQELPAAAARRAAWSRTRPRDAGRSRAWPPGWRQWRTRPRSPTSPRPTCPLLHPAFVRAVVRAAKSEDVDVALPVVHGFRHPLAAAYRTSLVPAVEELIAEDRMRPAFLFERSRVRELSEEDLLRDRELAEADPELLSVLNLNEPDDYARARSRAAPSVTVRRFGTLATNLGREPIAIRAATLEAAASGGGRGARPPRRGRAERRPDHAPPRAAAARAATRWRSWRRTREAEPMRVRRPPASSESRSREPHGCRRRAARARRRASRSHSPATGQAAERSWGRSRSSSRGRTRIRSTCSTGSRWSSRAEREGQTA